MALRQRIRRSVRRAVKGGLSRMRKPMPAPPSDPTLDGRVAGIHRLDPESWQLPDGLAEAGETETRGLRLGSLVTLIIVLAVLFILVITTFVARMPAE